MRKQDTVVIWTYSGSRIPWESSVLCALCASDSHLGSVQICYSEVLLQPSVSQTFINSPSLEAMRNVRLMIEMFAAFLLNHFSINHLKRSHGGTV
jgi:hypothetical protein